MSVSLTAFQHVCRVCWRVFWAQPLLVAFSVCWVVSLSSSSAALAPFWCLNGCFSTSAGRSPFSLFFRCLVTALCFRKSQLSLCLLDSVKGDAFYSWTMNESQFKMILIYTYHRASVQFLADSEIRLLALFNPARFSFAVS